MSTSVSIQTGSGQIINGINYSVNAATLPSDPVTLAANMQGGMAYGVYHIRTRLGWVEIPASNISSVLRAKAGAPT